MKPSLHSCQGPKLSEKVDFDNIDNVLTTVQGLKKGMIFTFPSPLHIHYCL